MNWQMPHLASRVVERAQDWVKWPELCSDYISALIFKCDSITPHVSHCCPVPAYSAHQVQHCPSQTQNEVQGPPDGCSQNPGVRRKALYWVALTWGEDKDDWEMMCLPTDEDALCTTLLLVSSLEMYKELQQLLTNGRGRCPPQLPLGFVTSQKPAHLSGSHSLIVRDDWTPATLPCQLALEVPIRGHYNTAQWSLLPHLLQLPESTDSPSNQPSKSDFLLPA
ncbi:hypothetical protein H920_08459 [Fukomys damarensis]|uniref:Uncharacterized protein n=1 Tax=Fukomys damarensis TaxID=885580 RepID=A0A091DGB8_FUKDA|nr:hypothetical protein H920_08459 [Fukomys damarensis]